MGTFGRYLGNRASVVLMVAVCTACGSSDEDTIEFTGGAAGVNGNGGFSAGEGGSSSVDAGLGGSGGSDGDAGSNGTPCEVAFVNPVASDGGVLTLGASDDVDGTACGTEFSTSVLVSSNASQVKLFVNGASNSSLEQAVANLTAAFASVQLGNRGDTANTLRAVATMADGRTCEADLGTDIFVDCDGPSCTITRPADNVAYLNAADDLSGDAGFQSTIEVETNSENAAQALQLTLDGDLDHQLSAQVEDVSGQGVATFSNITLPEGQRSAQATCRDGAGNVVNSPRVDFTVDTIACTVQVAALPALITPGSDGSGLPGIQIAVNGTMPAPNADCSHLAVGVCSSLTDNDFAVLGSNTGFTQTITLASLTQSNDVCARVRDLAGNIGEGQVTANVRVDAPRVVINTPTNLTQVDVASDGNQATGTCEVDFQVDCEDVDSPVQLLEGSTVRASANCDQNNNVSPPYHGRVTFNDVSLASRNDGTDVTLTARQSASDLIGTASVTIGLDCQAPQPSFANSVGCGGLLSLVGDDTQSGTAGLQFTVSVLNDGAPNVVLTVTRGAATSLPDATNSSGSSTLFEDADLGGVGNIVLSACATDPQGNQGCVLNCALEIADVPTVDITNPANAAILTTDCDTNVAGLQVRVQGTTDAVNGSSAVITVGGTATPGVPVTGGAFDACVNAPTDGPNQTLTVAVTDLIKGAPPGSDSVTVTVDGNSPTQNISTLVVGPFQRRQGIAHFSWTAVPDVGGGPLASYEMRCATTSIDDETEWTAATPKVVNVAPAASGSQVDDISGFRVGTTSFCALRGRDFGGTLTPLPASNTTVNNVFLEQPLTVPAGGGAFASVAPIGDINGDTFPDLIYGSLNVSARVFFGNGGSTAPNGTHDIEITGITGGLGAVVAGLGDISGDGRPDFAVSARALSGSAGAVYVFFGKATNTWDPDLTVNAANCGEADICFIGSEASALLGWDMTSADVNGDTQLDLVIAARQASTVGRVYVILGGAQLGVGGGAIFDLPGAAATLNGFIIAPPTLTSNFGTAVASVGEGDLVIGANGQTAGGNTGRAFFATEATHSGTGLLAYSGTLSEFDSGQSAEFATQARPIGNFSSTVPGAVALGGSFHVGGIAQIYPRPFSLTTVVNFFNDGADNDWSQNIGASFHPAFGLVGDLDKDTFAEFAVGAFEPGTVELFYGGLTAGELAVCRTTPSASICNRSLANYHRNSAGTGQMYPNFVGDINGDTFNDLAVIDFGTSITDTLTILY